MQVLSIDLVVLNIKMRNMVLNHVLVPIQITKIKPVSKGHRREKIVVYPRKRALCPCRCAGVPWVHQVAVFILWPVVGAED